MPTISDIQKFSLRVWTNFKSQISSGTCQRQGRRGAMNRRTCIFKKTKTVTGLVDLAMAGSLAPEHLHATRINTPELLRPPTSSTIKYPKISTLDGRFIWTGHLSIDHSTSAEVHILPYVRDGANQTDFLDVVEELPPSLIVNYVPQQQALEQIENLPDSFAVVHLNIISRLNIDRSRFESLRSRLMDEIGNDRVGFIDVQSPAVPRFFIFALRANHRVPIQIATLLECKRPKSDTLLYLMWVDKTLLEDEPLSSLQVRNSQTCIMSCIKLNWIYTEFAFSRSIIKTKRRQKPSQQ